MSSSCFSSLISQSRLVLEGSRQVTPHPRLCQVGLGCVPQSACPKAAQDPALSLALTIRQRWQKQGFVVNTWVSSAGPDSLKQRSSFVFCLMTEQVVVLLRCVTASHTPPTALKKPVPDHLDVILFGFKAGL